MNEETNVREAVAALGKGVEVIVADGGSADNTREAARKLGASVVLTPAGRGLQMDAAALRATGDALLFLHADTRLPPGWLDSITDALKDTSVVGGGFGLSIDSKEMRFRLLEAAVNLRSRLFKLVYGDQAIFARKEAFLKAGGFNKLPLMEDVYCVKRLRKAGRFVLLKGRVKTSGRRWSGRGILRNALKNWLFLMLYNIGVAPERLYGWYYGSRSR